MPRYFDAASGILVDMTEEQAEALETAREQEGINHAAERQRERDVEADKAPVRDIASLLTRINTRQTQIAADRAALPSATLADLKPILNRMLQSEDDILTALSRLAKALSRLA